jgi:hypothetical protein
LWEEDAKRCRAKRIVSLVELMAFNAFLECSFKDSRDTRDVATNDDE